MIEGPRPVRPNEYRSLLKLVNRTFIGSPGERGMESLYPWHLSSENRRNLWVTVENGKVVSHVGVSKRALAVDGVRIPLGLMSAVATDPAYRGAGLASRIIEVLRSRHDREGLDLYFISGDRGLYRRIGAVPVGRRLHFVLTPAALGLFAHPDVSFRPAGPRDLAAIAALHAREPVRILRPVADFRRVFRAGWAVLSPARFFVAEAGGRVTAYFVAGVTRKAGGPQSGRLVVVEHAGSRTDLLAALHAACLAWGKRRVELTVSPHERESLALLSGRHLGERHVPVYDAIAILNLERLIRRLRPVLAKRAGPAGRRLEGGEFNFKPFLALGASRVAVPREVMTRLIFGEPTRDRPPGVRADGALGRVLRAGFPIPLANPGISYV
ncbi:MAG: GNAT family N-acetyltransferase [Candidatus Coatesbacteria bacterium]